MAAPEPSKSSPQARASQVFRVPAVWVPPAILVAGVVLVMTLVYFGSVVDPTGHLHGLPVAVVNEDAGAMAGSRRVHLGQEVAAGLTGSPAVSSRLSLRAATLSAAKGRMDVGKEYAAVVIPPGFTTSLLALSGLPIPAGRLRSRPTIELLTNPRAGTLGVSLATGVLGPALDRASRRIGQRLLRSGNTRTSDTAASVLLNDPVTVAVVRYRPLPSHTALGLSAFYISLITIFCGFLGAVVVHTSVDAGLGYAPTEIGPMWRQRQPVAISRWQTLLAKWAIAVPLTVVLTGVMLAAAVGILGMDTPHFWYLWLLTWFAAAVVAVGTLVLFAALGTLGQLAALLVFVYLALASSGGTVPLKALSGFFRFLANFEPLRQILDGVRAILYFDARGEAGLTRAFVATALGLVFWVLLGALVTIWYDRKKLYRMPPELMAYVDEAVRGYKERTQAVPRHARGGPGSASTPTDNTAPSEPQPPPRGPAPT
jgi:YhgE/Pip-like protein